MTAFVSPTTSGNTTNAVTTPSVRPTTRITVDKVTAVLQPLIPRLQLSGNAAPSCPWLISFADEVMKAINSLASDGAGEYLGLCLPTQISKIILNKEFTFPAEPTARPTFTASSWDDAERHAELREHDYLLIHYTNHVAIDKALQNFLLEIIPPEFLPDTFVVPCGLSTSIFWPANYRAYELINEIFDTWNNPTSTDSHYYESLFRSEWSLDTSSVPAYLRIMDKAQILATLLKNPYTDRQMTIQAHATICNTIKLTDANKEWDALNFTQQTYTNLKKIYTKHYKNCQVKKIPFEVPTHQGAFAVTADMAAVDFETDDASVATLSPRDIAELVTVTVNESLAPLLASMTTTATSPPAPTTSSVFTPPPYASPPPIQHQAHAVVPPPPPVQYVTHPPVTQPPSTQLLHGQGYVVPPPAPAYVPPPQGVVPPPAPSAPQPRPSQPRRPNQRNQRPRRNQNNQNVPYSNRVKVHANHLYCSSCGCDVDHSSPSCPQKRVGHDDRVVHKDQARTIRNSNPTATMPCLKNFHKDLWPSASI